jgi:hypothetical protein
MDLPYSDQIDIKYLTRLFDNKSECYKLFWFEAIINLVSKGRYTATYDELINEMIVSAWYMVSEYHLNLGPRDKLEAVINRLMQLSNGALKTSDSRENVLAFISECQDKDVSKAKRDLTNEVPYRLQSPFLENVKGKEWNVSVKLLAEKINLEKRLIYYFSDISGMQSRICIQKQWTDYIDKNHEILQGWIEYNKIIYLQRRNPSVPGIANKLYPRKDRDLGCVKKYWKSILMIHPIREIYGGNLLTDKDSISIDHFIPWSYVTHDELWNLSPTTRSINSAKSNYLPEWGIYFNALCDIEFNAYELVWKYEHVHDTFEECKYSNINESRVREELYHPNMKKVEFCGMLSDIMLPVYKAAEKIGFRDWKFTHE